MSFAINHSSDADVIRATTLPAGSGSEGIPASISHPQVCSSRLAVYCPGGLPLPYRSTRALSSTAGERSVRFAIWPSPLPCRAAGGEGIRDGLINRIPTRESRLPAHSEAA